MSEKRAMEISGHKTCSCFERYHIVSLSDIQESGRKMDMWIKSQRRANEKKISPADGVDHDARIQSSDVPVRYGPIRSRAALRNVRSKIRSKQMTPRIFPTYVDA